ncbi:MAG: TatD family hydrolase [Verrucomicrobiota bacterium]|nr:TatD family hydrolase [Verrucomicrobiota bacterium]
MTIIEPHIHMYSRTTDDYQAMYRAGIRACLEPSFWLGANRRYAGTFFDYFRLILDFETVRARRFGIDHFCAISVNPKEAEDTKLVDEVIAGIGPYLDHPRCVAMGEIGFNNTTPNEEKAFVRQFHIAMARAMPVIVHLPHVEKLKGARRTVEILKAEGINSDLVVLDHNTEETIELSLNAGCYAGMTVYPISKLTPERVSNMIRRCGSRRIIVNGSADWGISDPLSLVKVVDFMKKDGHGEAAIRDLVFNNAMTFYGQSSKWKPELDFEPIDPKQFQR